MKRALAVAMLVLAASLASFVVYFGTRPPVAVEQLRDALVRLDRGAMERLIHFPSLRESVKGRLRQELAASAASSGKPGAILGALIAERLLEPLVDLFVSPSGIAAIVAGNKMRDMPKGPPAPTNRQDSGASLQFAGAWESPSRYAVTVSDKGAKTAVLVMHRFGLFEWKLAELR